MATFLEIAQDVAALSGTVDRRAVTTVVEAPGRVGNIARLVRAAWLEIQNQSRSWRFLTVEYPSTTVLAQGIGAFTPENVGLRNWADWLPGDEAETVPITVWPATAQAGENADDLRRLEQPMVYTDYRRFRESYLTGAEAVADRTGQPNTFAVDTLDRMVVWPTPDRDYRLAGTYRRAPQVLTGDEDVPIIAEQFHDAIVWAATLLLHREDEADANVLITTEQGLRERMVPLRRRYQGQPALAFRPLGAGRSGYSRPLSPRSLS